MPTDSSLPQPVTSLAYGTLPNNKGEFLFVWRELDRLLETVFFVGNLLKRTTRKVGITSDDAGITITWRGQNELHIPTTGDKASLNGQEFEIQRLIVESDSVGLLICCALGRMPTSLDMR